MIELLKQVFLFETLSERQLERVAGFCRQVKLDRNELLFRDGDKAAAFYAIIRGRVKVFKLSRDGGEHILEMREEPDLVAEAAIFDRETYPAFCRAVDDSELIMIPKKEFVSLIYDHPEVALSIMNAYSKRLRIFVRMVEDLSLSDVKTRLARHLIQNSRSVNDELVCDLTLSKKELAALLGTIPETLSRTLRHFKNEGLITETRSQIVITDRKKMNLYTA